MPKYLIEASYTAEGAKGLIKGGGTARRAEVQKWWKVWVATWMRSISCSGKMMFM